MNAWRVRQLLAAVFACALTLTVIFPARPTAAADFTVGVATGTVYFNRYETQMAAKSAEVALVVICGPLLAVPPVPVGMTLAASCGAKIGMIVIQAEHAKARNMCLKVKYVLVSPYQQWWDVYRGSRCK